MNRYKIFEHPTGKIETIKQGWSWPAFFFNSIWALVKRRWVLGSTLCAASLIVGFLGGAAGGDMEKAINILTLIGSLAIGIAFGFNGNSWREGNLQSRGYEFKTTVAASTPEGAIGVFMIKSKTAR